MEVLNPPEDLEFFNSSICSLSNFPAQRNLPIRLSNLLEKELDKGRAEALYHNLEGAKNLKTSTL
jgi:hypothetical protein